MSNHLSGVGLIYIIYHLVSICDHSSIRNSRQMCRKSSHCGNRTLLTVYTALQCSVACKMYSLYSTAVRYSGQSTLHCIYILLYSAIHNIWSTFYTYLRFHQPVLLCPAFLNIQIEWIHLRVVSKFLYPIEYFVVQNKLDWYIFRVYFADLWVILRKSLQLCVM